MRDVHSELLGDLGPATADRKVQATVYTSNAIPGFTESDGGQPRLIVEHRENLRYEPHGLSIRTPHGRLFIPWPQVEYVVTQILASEA